jgi:regulator of replication initiation timing
MQEELDASQRQCNALQARLNGLPVPQTVTGKEQAGASPDSDTSPVTAREKQAADLRPAAAGDSQSCIARNVSFGTTPSRFARELLAQSDADEEVAVAAAELAELHARCQDLSAQVVEACAERDEVRQQLADALALQANTDALQAEHDSLRQRLDEAVANTPPAKPAASREEVRLVPLLPPQFSAGLKSLPSLVSSFSRRVLQGRLSGSPADSRRGSGVGDALHERGGALTQSSSYRGLQQSLSLRPTLSSRGSLASTVRRPSTRASSTIDRAHIMEGLRFLQDNNTELCEEIAALRQQLNAKVRLPTCWLAC